MRRSITGRFLPRPMRETAPIFHNDELSRAARVLSAAAAAKRKAVRAEYVKRHCAEVLASLGK